MPNKTPRFLVTDADGFADNNQNALIILQISRKEIESMNFTSSLERLMIMTDTRENTLRYRESILIHVTGYDSDMRELAEIPDVRRFFKRLVNEWPHWLWFLSREQGSISLLLSLICDIKIHRDHRGMSLEFTTPGELSVKVNDLLSRGIALFSAFDISQLDAKSSAESAVAALRLD